MDVCMINASISSHCSSCLHGSLCQFTNQTYRISTFEALSCSIKSIPLSILLLILIIGTVCNTLSFATFCQSNARRMGSGIYRLWISLIGQLNLTILILHFIFEKQNQNEYINCFIFEYFEQVLHSLYESLTACVTLERTIVILQGVSFNKIGSRRIARSMIVLLIGYHCLRFIHEPFYRQVEFFSNRFWCVVNTKTHSLHQYEQTTNLIAFLIPFFINLFSPFVWIIALTKHRLTLKKNLSIWHSFKYVLYTYRHIVIACYLLVLVNLPRFALLFPLICIEYLWQIAYLISCIPLIFSLVIFVLLSPKYAPMFFVLIRWVRRSNWRRQYFIR